MKKWWRKFKNSRGWDFTKELEGLFFYRADKKVEKYSDCVGGGSCKVREVHLVSDPNGCYSYTCRYCGKQLLFPWKETNLAYHNMQRHIKVKHIDVL